MTSKNRPVQMGDLSFQTRLIHDDLIDSWSQILDSSSFIGGRHVSDFEDQFAAYIGARNAIGVGNGTDALEIILQGLELSSGSKVLVQGNSFVASAEAAMNSGLSVDFFDVKSDFTIDLDDLRAKLTQNVKAVIVVHLYGHPQPMRQVLDLLEPHGVFLIEDCAQAHGAAIDGQKVGTFGLASAFSFYPGKNLGALGDAGAIVTNDSMLAEKFRRISNHGRLSKFDHLILGRNSRLDPIQAAALILKLKHLDAWNERRLRNSKRYRELLGGVSGIKLPPEIDGSVYHHFVVQHSNREALREFLSDAGVQTGLHYPEALTQTPYLRGQKASCAISERLANEILSLPVAEHLELEDVDFVSEQILRFCETF